MKRTCHRIAASALAWIACLTFAAQVGAQDELILRGGRLFDGVGDALRPNTGIVVRGGKFMEVGADLTGRDLSAARVIELADDDTILPGVFDLHAHYNVNILGSGRHDETTVIPVLFLANGATSTFPAGEYDPEPMLELRRAIDRGEAVGPRIFSSGPYFGTANANWPRNATTEDVYAQVDKWAELGAGGFKAKGIRPEHLKPLIDRAHQHGLTVTGHLDSGSGGRSVNPRDAILMGIDRIEHFLGGDVTPPTRSAYASLQNFDPDTPEGSKALDDIIALFIKHDVTFDATLTAYGYYGDRGEGFDYWVDEKSFFTPYAREQMAARARPHRINEQFFSIFKVKHKTLKRFHDAGGRITVGTDHPSTGDYIAGFSWHREVDAFVRAGIPAAAALKCATIDGARAMGVGDKLGSIEAGKFADLLIIKGNPLENIRATRTMHTVMKAGQVYKTQELFDSVKDKLGPKGPDDERWWDRRD